MNLRVDKCSVSVPLQNLTDFGRQAPPRGDGSFRYVFLKRWCATVMDFVSKNQNKHIAQIAYLGSYCLRIKLLCLSLPQSDATKDAAVHLA
ncbi:hypothetical protein NPIL_525911 [Nephila pilipes]|uniref:Uncharacterized protein n=1 Tax=Nephila pilipes TaxID=299642 RepID=A0A8X6PVZ3_NEPPI|nr:hypothetical protein NPIL_525911 [Nephila pilipes]